MVARCLSSVAVRSMVPGEQRWPKKRHSASNVVAMASRPSPPILSAGWLNGSPPRQLISRAVLEAGARPQVNDDRPAFTTTGPGLVAVAGLNSRWAAVRPMAVPRDGPSTSAWPTTTLAEVRTVLPPGNGRGDSPLVRNGSQMPEALRLGFTRCVRENDVIEQVLTLIAATATASRLSARLRGITAMSVERPPREARPHGPRWRQL